MTDFPNPLCRQAQSLHVPSIRIPVPDHAA